MTDHNQALAHAKKYANSSQSEHANLCRAYLELVEQLEKLQRGEFICKKCGLRKDSVHDCAPEF